MGVRHSGFLLSDKLYIKLVFFCKMGYFPNLENPKAFSEKIQWLKLNDHNPLYHQMVDKAAVKALVAAKIGEEHILRTYGVWDRPEDIDWDSLPDKFVLKLTAGGGGRSVCVCKDKATFDKENAIRRLNKDAGRDLYKRYREWAYKDVPQKIIAEEYLETGDPGGTPPDYKFWCFNGEPLFLMFCRGRENSSRRAFNFYDIDWNPLLFWRKYPNSDELVPKPDKFDEMKEIASRLSQGIPFLRVDLYCEKGQIFFSELTFYPGSGTNPFHPEDWDIKVGDLLQLPQ